MYTMGLPTLRLNMRSDLNSNLQHFRPDVAEFIQLPVQDVQLNWN